MKVRRKHELASEKRQRMCTGGGPVQPSTSNETQLDTIMDNVNIELVDVIDSDTIALVQNNDSVTPYVLLEDNVLTERDNSLDENIMEENIPATEISKTFYIYLFQSPSRIVKLLLKYNNRHFLS